MTTVEIDLSEWKEFFERVGKSEAEFKNEIKKFTEELGEEFLRIVEDEIIRLEVVDTRLLLNSFKKGGQDNIWSIEDNGFSVEVGTNVEYASYVNDGHWTNTKGVKMRWIPGTWNGDRFVYTPGAKTGMLLKQKWIPGSHYFDSALNIMEKMIPQILEEKLAEWMSAFLGV